MNLQMLLFTAIANFINMILLLLIFVLTLNILYKGYYTLKNYLNYKKVQDSSLKGIITLNDIIDLSPFEFEHWCEIFLQKEGYIIKEIKNTAKDGYVDIICKRGTEEYYVECRKHHKSYKGKFIINVSIINKLIGAMSKDNIKNGMLITTGIISKEAIQYTKTMPDNYNIKLFDGNDLITSHSNQIQNFFKKPCPEKTGAEK